MPGDQNTDEYHITSRLLAVGMDIVDDLLNYVDKFFCTTTTQCLLDTSLINIYNYTKHSNKNFYQISY